MVGRRLFHVVESTSSRFQNPEMCLSLKTKRTFSLRMEQREVDMSQ